MKTLISSGHEIADPKNQIHILESAPSNGLKQVCFEDKLKTIDLYPLKPAQLEILQVNVGKMCNQTCSHCHVDAGPDRTEIMTKETMQHCLNALKNTPSIHTVDITGGAPEMNPNFKWFVEQISETGKQIIVRSNLTILVSNNSFRTYPKFFKDHKLNVISSLPCYTLENTDKQRGSGVFKKSIEALKTLNSLGYGKEDSGLELHLVYNPLGAYLPGNQDKLEEDYKRVLFNEYGIIFNKLFTITNMPISRFLEDLLSNEKYEEYMTLLINSFNPSSVLKLMCRNTISIGWDGMLYDCDFNQMLDIKTEPGSPQNIAQLKAKKLSERNIMMNQHCYGCTAGAGSSCQGSIAT